MESQFIPVSATFRLPASFWQPENRGATIRKISEALSQTGVVSLDLRDPERHRENRCMVCGWIHDAEFTQLRLKDGQTITLSGALPDIVRVVHRAHERGFERVSTKAGELQRACGGYHHPSKAFDDLNQRASYKLLFDRSWRGFISLRGVISTSRNLARNEAPRALL